MAYLALKPCRFAGQSFKIGESVPAAVLQPGASKSLVKMGILAEDSDVKASAPAKPAIKHDSKMKVVVHEKKGDMDLDLTQEGLQAIFDVLTSSVSAAEPIIDAMTDEDALILLHVSDSRKSIKELAETKAKALSGAQEAAESDESAEEGETPEEGEEEAQEGAESEGE